MKKDSSIWNWFSPEELYKDGAAFLTLASISLGLGLFFNAYRDKTLPLVYQSKEERLVKAVEDVKESGAPDVSPYQGAMPATLSLEEFRLFSEKEQGMVLDARPEIFYRLGHVPGALSLPREDFQNTYPSIKEKLEKNKMQPIAIYCSSSTCEDSKLLQKVLSSMGYGNTVIFTGGWSAWGEAQLPEERKQ